jgi:hypothetical protein
MPTHQGMHTSRPPLNRSMEIDFGGLGCLALAMWGLAVIVHGAALAACPGCESSQGGRALAVTGTLVLACASIVHWTRGIRLAATIIVGPGIATSIALFVVPDVPLHLLGLALVPWSIAAARGAVRSARSLEFTAATWAFAFAGVVGASAAGLGAVAAVGVVVVCARATPFVLAFELPPVPDVVPDDLI